MPITPLSNVNAARINLLDPVEVELPQELTESTEDGATKSELPDGGVVINLRPQPKNRKSDKFDANLAEEMEDSDLAQIASDLLEGIHRDEESRREHLENLAEGIKLLGLVLESQASGSTASAPLDGMSTIRHPLLLEACQLFQANAMSSLLPAAGPAKVRDDKPDQPPELSHPMMGHNGGPPLNPLAQPVPPAAVPPGPPVQAGPNIPPQDVPPGALQHAALPQRPGAVGAPPGPAGGQLPLPPGAPGAIPPQAQQALGMNFPQPPPVPPQQETRDELANALEKDFNHYLTVIAKEYVPDTDQMLFKVGFGGLGIKKVYNCPRRRRPVSESIDIEDFIVDKNVADLSNAGRITHRSRMRPSVMRRMQILGVYRDIPLGVPVPDSSPNALDQAKAQTQGVEVSVSDPRDADYVVYECCCELDLPEFAPIKFKNKGLPLPYRVTIERESQKVLEIRRNWKKDDEECIAKEFYVDFPYIRAFGFYCIGLLHLLGNTTKTLTALWREFIDAGMFANFPGFLYLKGAGRQYTNQFRVAPGSGVGLDAAVQDIRQAVMPLPYKSPEASFVAFAKDVADTGQRVGGTANIQIGEGRQDAPVGTTLALIEQATKPLGAVNKRLHNAQAKELQLFKERFKEDPGAFMRFNKKPAMRWEEQQFLKALEDYDLVPVSDPNNPTKMHRAAKAEWLKQVAVAAPGLLDAKKVYLRAADNMEIEDPAELLAPPMPPQGPPVDPAKMADVQHKNAKLAADQQSNLQENQLELVKTQAQAANDDKERQNRIDIALIEQQTERLRLSQTLAVHGQNLAADEKTLHLKTLADAYGKAQQRAHEHHMSNLGHEQSLHKGQVAQEQQAPVAEAAE